MKGDKNFCQMFCDPASQQPKQSTECLTINSELAGYNGEYKTQGVDLFLFNISLNVVWV